MLGGVRIPLCTLNALDDPVVTERMLPAEALAANGAIAAYVTRRGGHLSWVRAGEEEESLMLEVVRGFLEDQGCFSPRGAHTAQA